jgi:hypothetical protein
MRRPHLIENIDDKTWAKFKKQAQIRGMKMGYYFDILIG